MFLCIESFFCIFRAIIFTQCLTMQLSPIFTFLSFAFFPEKSFCVLFFPQHPILLVYLYPPSPFSYLILRSTDTELLYPSLSINVCISIYQYDRTYMSSLASYPSNWFLSPIIFSMISTSSNLFTSVSISNATIILYIHRFKLNSSSTSHASSYQLYFFYHSIIYNTNSHLLCIAVPMNTTSFSLLKFISYTPSRFMPVYTVSMYAVIIRNDLLLTLMKIFFLHNIV